MVEMMTLNTKKQAASYFGLASSPSLCGICMIANPIGGVELLEQI